MSSKKVIAVLLTVGVVASTSAMVSKINIKEVFAESVKQNVVYSKEDTTTASQDDGTGNVTGAEEEAYKERVLDILKNYFNISVEENENSKFSACILNEKTLDVIQLKEQEWVQEEYDKKEISKEEYDKRMAGIEENDNGLKERVKKLKHGLVQAVWFDGDKCYMFDFNENSKEIDFAMASEGDTSESDVPLTISEDQLKNTAEDFIKQNKLADIQKPKCIFIKGKHLFYEDENDSTKKAEICINPATGKVWSFSVKAYAELEYNTAINKK